MFHCFFIDDSLMTLWRTIDDTTNIGMQLVSNIKAFNVLIFKFWCFFAAWLTNSCWFLEEMLMRPWWFRCKYIMIVFFVTISESLVFHCSVIDDSLMILWRKIDGTAKVWMQTLKIIEVSNVIIIRTLMFLCCWIGYSLMILWIFFDKVLIISLQTLSISNSLTIRCWFLGESLKLHRRFWCKQ